MTEQHINTTSQFEPADLENIPGLDLEFYRFQTRMLEDKGFTLLGDVRDLAWEKENTRLSTCLRLMSGDEGTIQAISYHMLTQGFLKLSKILVPLEQKFLDLETEFSDGYFLQTTNNTFTMNKSHIGLHCIPSGAVISLLEKHRERVKDYLKKNPHVQVRKATGLAGVLESQARQRRLSKDKELRRKWKQDRKKLQREQLRVAGIPGPKTTPRDILAGNACRYRKVVLKFASVVILALILASLNTSSANRKHERARILTRDVYQAAYDRQVARMTRPVRPTWVSLGSTVFLFAIIFGAYEFSRKGGAYILARTLCKDSAREEPVEEFKFPESSPDAWTVKKGRFAGKVAVIILIGTLMGFYYHGQDVKTYERGQKLTYDIYVKGFEKIKEKAAGRPESFGGELMSSLFLMGLLVLLYEFGGKIGEAVAWYKAVRRIPLGMHVLLSIAGLIFLFFGGSLFWVMVVIRNLNLSGNNWLQIPLFFLGPILSVRLATWLANVVPGQCKKCGGRAFRTKYNPITYTCRQCGYEHSKNLEIG